MSATTTSASTKAGRLASSSLSCDRLALIGGPELVKNLLLARLSPRTGRGKRQLFSLSVRDPGGVPRRLPFQRRHLWVLVSCAHSPHLVLLHFGNFGFTSDGLRRPRSWPIRYVASLSSFTSYAASARAIVVGMVGGHCLETPPALCTQRVHADSAPRTWPGSVRPDQCHQSGGKWEALGGGGSAVRPPRTKMYGLRGGLSHLAAAKWTRPRRSRPLLRTLTCPGWACSARSCEPGRSRSRPGCRDADAGVPPRRGAVAGLRTCQAARRSQYRRADKAVGLAGLGGAPPTLKEEKLGATARSTCGGPPSPPPSARSSLSCEYSTCSSGLRAPRRAAAQQARPGPRPPPRPQYEEPRRSGSRTLKQVRLQVDRTARPRIW